MNESFAFFAWHPFVMISKKCFIAFASYLPSWSCAAWRLTLCERNHLCVGPVSRHTDLHVNQSMMRNFCIHATILLSVVTSTRRQSVLNASFDFMRFIVFMASYSLLQIAQQVQVCTFTDHSTCQVTVRSVSVAVLMAPMIPSVRVSFSPTRTGVFLRS